MAGDAASSRCTEDGRGGAAQMKVVHLVIVSRARHARAPHALLVHVCFGSCVAGVHRCRLEARPFIPSTLTSM